MNEVMTRIELGGVLGKIFGKVHYRLITTTHEASRALCSTLNGFEKFMISSKRRGLTFAVFKGKSNLSIDEINYPSEGKTIRIVPVIIGSKRGGILQTILGVALVAVAAFAPWGAAIWASNLAFTVGTAIAVGGVIQMLSPQPKGLAIKQDADNKPSYAFGGVTNTTAQGNPVPLGYGRRRIGGAVISAGIYVEDQQ